MNIVYSSDDNYAKYAGISIISLFENNKDELELNVYILNNNISKDNIYKLEEISKKYNRKIQFINFNDICTGLNNNDGFSEAAYGRLFLQNISNINKIIYLDCDTIIKSSLRELWDIDIDGYFVAGVQDNPIKCLVEIIGMDDNDRYINSGVLVMNLKMMRDKNIIDKITEFIKKYRGEVPHHDQGVINGVFKNKIKVLHPKYNVMSQFWEMKRDEIKKLYEINNYYNESEIREAKEQPIVIHYIEKFYGRPWNDNCTHPMKYEYLFYLNISPWNNKLSMSKFNIGIEIRKLIFNYLGFSIYFIVEKMLNIKRINYYRKKYKFIYKGEV